MDLNALTSRNLSLSLSISVHCLSFSLSLSPCVRHAQTHTHTTTTTNRKTVASRLPPRQSAPDRGTASSGQGAKASQDFRPYCYYYISTTTVAGLVLLSLLVFLWLLTNTIFPIFYYCNCYNIFLLEQKDVKNLQTMLPFEGCYARANKWYYYEVFRPL